MFEKREQKCQNFSLTIYVSSRGVGGVYPPLPGGYGCPPSPLPRQVSWIPAPTYLLFKWHKFQFCKNIFLGHPILQFFA